MLSFAGRCALAFVVIAGGCVALILRESVEGAVPSGSLRDAWLELRGAHVYAGATLLGDNASAWAARWEVLSTATDTIDASYFIVEDDAFGMAFLGKLLEKAEDGVRVRLLLDARGSEALTSDARDYLQELVQSGGVDVRIFNPPLPQLLVALLERSLVPMASASHNKILVVDCTIAVTGGRNVSRLYFSTLFEDANAVTDADVLLDGADAVASLASVLEDEFEAPVHYLVPSDIVNLLSRRDELRLIAAAMDAWVNGDVECQGGSALDLERLARAATGVDDDAAIAAARPRLVSMTAATSVCDTLPTRVMPRFDVEATVVTGTARAQRFDDSVNEALLRAVGGASESIVFDSAYFILTPRLLAALEAASQRGVVIQLLTNSPLSSDNDFAEALFIDSWPEIVARVPTLRVFVTSTEQMQHAKRAIFDDELTFIGSFNIDPFSLHVNSELLVAIWSREFAAQSRASLEGRLADGSMLEYRVAHDDDGLVRREKPGGAVIIAFGPDDHVPADQLARLRALKWLLLAQRRLWDFEVVVW
ncbi:MAG: phosphatidylserine/phosphatidylglycerophosphate/cardiolipin synthase family protein [Deltaproteobacteria bacterium]|nr:phosphatidylserine/phosphatidylglycerophosphate/cardiolipin synthase family protein [Deltaproteobacteria bacterium]